MEHQEPFDLAIVGGGIIGLSTAWRLSQRGMRVAVADARIMAGEASMAAAGMLAPGGEAHGDSPWARHTVEARATYPDFVSELKGASGLEIDFRECGALDVASNDEAWAELAARRAIQERLGIRVREVGEAEGRELIPLLRPGSFRALYYPDDAIVDPCQVNAALEVALKRVGVTLLIHEPVSAIEPDGDGYAIRVDDASGCRVLLRAGSVVLAAGAWSNEITLPGRVASHLPAPRRTMPVRGHLVEREGTPGALLPIAREDHLYVFQRNRGTLLTGSNEERVGFDRTPNPAVVEQILDRTDRLLPGLFAPRAENSSWVGFRPGIEGEGPELRRLPEERIWLAYGHYRNGILLAPRTAAYLAGEIAE
ncbi:MAG: FAD-dependent oxidoreductase [Bryobacterales bacterium]|nr:FAD-dependent oxidoreductase [Bryobacterales bacterium]